MTAVGAEAMRACAVAGANRTRKTIAGASRAPRSTTIVNQGQKHTEHLEILHPFISLRMAQSHRRMLASAAPAETASSELFSPGGAIAESHRRPSRNFLVQKCHLR
jgi:hypothetical protein